MPLFWLAALEPEPAHCPMKDCSRGTLGCLTPWSLLSCNSRLTAVFRCASINPLAPRASLPFKHSHRMMPLSSSPALRPLSKPHNICSSTIFIGENGALLPSQFLRLGSGLGPNSLHWLVPSQPAPSAGSSDVQARHVWPRALVPSVGSSVRSPQILHGETRLLLSNKGL